MRTVDLSALPDELYGQVEKLARVRGTSVDDVVASFIARAFSGDDEREARLLAEIRARRAELSHRGIVATAGDIQAAKVQGRK